jgi:magnesium-transporting ATPase (P-type)
MAFTTLMLLQMFTVLNARSDARSASVHVVANGWLWAAIAGSVVLQLLVVHMPFLQRGFGTTALSAGDWAFSLAVASSVRCGAGRKRSGHTSESAPRRAGLGAARVTRTLPGFK